jgi:heme/copper-type cytochrome/quinol oxidase subunit 1
MPIRKIKTLITPRALALYLSFCFFVIGISPLVNGDLDIQLHDTYFIVARSHVYYGFSVLFFTFSVIYFILDIWLAKGKGHIF